MYAGWTQVVMLQCGVEKTIEMWRRRKRRRENNKIVEEGIITLRRETG